MSWRDLAERTRNWLAGPAVHEIRGVVDRVAYEQYHHHVRTRVALGRLLATQVAGTATSLGEAEFSVFSQNGEDGIIEYLLRHCDVLPERFVEIGVESYAEANTRFLAEHRRWGGVIVDLQPDLEADLARTHLDWRSQVRAVCARVTRDNVLDLLAPHVTPGDVGLLSLDIDGVDYWVLEPLLTLQPAMVIVEYNALFGPTDSVSVPYDADFDRRLPDRHGIYYGASLAAFAHRLGAAGYGLVGCVDAGNNAFFVHHSRLRHVAVQTVEEAFRPPRFVEHRDAAGALTGRRERSAQLHDVAMLPLVDVVTGETRLVSDLAGLA